MNWDIAGHKRQLKFFDKALSEENYAHAYLLAGPEGTGKKTIARKFAQGLLGLGTAFHPDYFELDGEGGIKIEQIRELAYKLSLKPYSAKYKVAVIDQAQEMTVEAANSLLKVLEEPKPNTIIILVTANPNRLPKTIVSRTQKINFGLVRFEEYSQLLSINLSAEQKKLIEILAAGSPARALKISSDEEFLTQLSAIEHNFEVFSSGVLIDRLLLAADLASEESSDIKVQLGIWLDHLSYDLRQNPSLQLKQKIEQLNLSQKYLDQNVSSKLALTNLMLNT